VVSAVFGCEPSLRLTEIPKEILKNIAEKYLPQEIIERKKKGLNYPFLQWLNESDELDVIRRIQKKTGMFQQTELDALLVQGKQGMFAQHIFSLYMLCKWMERHKM
jgi:asparagine synthase (glutamine-hydrolysing)